MSTFINLGDFKAKCETFGQEHILKQLPNLTADSEIVKQLSELDLETSFNNFYCKASDTDDVLHQYPIQPVLNSIHWTSTDNEMKADLNEIGLKLLRDAAVGAVILSGGQGTRLGFSGPKGMYIYGMPSGKSIFQIHIERIAKLRELVRDSANSQNELPHIPIYIMTSDLNNQIIINYFRSKQYFNYPQEDIYFFEQGVEPCFTFDGKLIIESPDSLAFAPDGNGGIYKALEKSGALSDMSRRGIEHLHVYGIDNILTKSLDPAFIGLCFSNNAQCGNKVVWRTDKTEKVGLTVVRNQRMCVVEYSEAPVELAESVDEEGKLIFGAANICNHYFQVSFIKDIVLPNLKSLYHHVQKKIPTMDPMTQQTITPTAANGIKFESFIFDVFQFAEKWLVMDVAREDEFAPIKNEPGNSVDSPDTARSLLTAQAKRWLHAVNATIIPADNSEDDICEISPLVSYAGEGLESFRDQTISLPFSFDINVDSI